MAGPGLGGCCQRWRERNDALTSRWREVTRRAPGHEPSAEQAARECRSAFAGLLREIQGLPAVRPALPLELTVLYNSLLFDIHLSSDSGKKLLAKIDRGLSRVLEACAVSGQELSLEDRWQRVLHGRTPEELQAPLHQLAALQGVLWLATNQLETAAGLFRLLSSAESLGPSPCGGCENELLSLLLAWNPPDRREMDLLVVQNARDVKDVLWTWAAFLQGFQELEAGDPPSALALLQAAATGLCSKRVLAQIFTLMGCCNLKMGKPQTAAQHLKRALQADAAFLPALFQAALLYRQLGLVGAELEALALLFQALDGTTQVTAESANPHFLIHTERLTCTPQLAAFYGQKSPSEVKYLLSRRCLQAGRAREAAEHYLDLLALLREGPRHHQLGGIIAASFQVPLRGDPVLPRIPEVFLEAASALEELARHQDAIAVCGEVVTRTSELVPERLCLDMEAPGSSSTEWPRSRALQEESLRCGLWRAAAYLLQGWAWARLGEAKEAVDHLSRCLNDLLRVQFMNTGNNSPNQEVGQTGASEAKVLSQIRQLALIRRGALLLEMQWDKKALMDFQHTLHICPDSPTANLYLLHTLWKLDRRPEAAARWQKFCSNTVQTEEEAGRPFPLYLLSCVKQMKFPYMEVLVRNLESYLGGERQGV
ncbi:hypothetical protein lerEdw1_010880 [Lerista edwardsae]|nr:hypothetical protein lerEdw1_010880 [Lerista edwardsae]